MKIGAYHSHFNGYEHLLVHKQALWRELKEAIGTVDAKACRTSTVKGQVYEVKASYSTVAICNAMKAAFEEMGWTSVERNSWVIERSYAGGGGTSFNGMTGEREVEAAVLTPNNSYNEADFVKNRVAVEVQFGKHAFVVFDLFVKHLAFYIGDKIDVGIEILPMKALQSEMSSGVSYYEGGLYDLIREGRGVPAVPLVLVGVTP